MEYDLKELIPAFRDSGYPHTYLPAEGASAAADRLLVDLNADQSEQQMVLEMLLVPGCSEPEILQFFVLLGRDFQEEVVPDLARLVARVNNELPVMGIGLTEEPRMVFYRHLLSFFPGALGRDLVLTVAHTIKQSILCFRPLIKQVMNGAKSYKEIGPELEKELQRVRSVALGDS